MLFTLARKFTMLWATFDATITTRSFQKSPNLVTHVLCCYERFLDTKCLLIMVFELVKRSFPNKSIMVSENDFVILTTY